MLRRKNARRLRVLESRRAEEIALDCARSGAPIFPDATERQSAPTELTVAGGPRVRILLAPAESRANFRSVRLTRAEEHDLARGWARLDGVVRGAEKARLNRSRSLAGRSDRPRQQSSQVTGGPMVRIHLPPATSQERTLRDVALGPSVLTEPEGARTSCHRLRPFDRYNCLAIIAPRADIPRC
jgi:hypothetical protein